MLWLSVTNATKVTLYVVFGVVMFEELPDRVGNSSTATEAKYHVFLCRLSEPVVV